MKTKEITFTVVLVVIIIAVIFSINYFKANENSINEETMKCIANNTILVVSKTCSHCANQKKALEPYLNDFKLLEVTENPDIIQKYNIRAVPTWIISEKIYEGEKSVNELKQLTGC